MKNKILIVVLITAGIYSCSIHNEVRNSGIYILDWYAEAVYVMDSTLLSTTEPLLLAGDGPSDIIVDDNNIFISNSGYGGNASVQKFSLTGDLILEKTTGEMTSPGYLEDDDENIYLSLWLDNSVIVMEKESLKTVKTITGLAAPQEIVRDGNIIYIGSNNVSETASIYKVNTDTWEKREIKSGSNPSYIDISDNKDIFVSCVGDYNSIDGSIIKISNDSIIHKTNFNSFLGKVKCIDGFVIVLDAMENAYILSSEDLSIIDTIEISSPSDVERVNDKVIFSTNVGKMYVSDLSSITEVVEIEPEYGFKTSEIFVR
ncbi:MAG: YncE family protein [bacterium]